MTHRTGILITVITALALAACDVSVNEDIDIADGAQLEGGANSVNGSIRVGADAEVEGNLRTVNGSIDLGERAKVGDVESVNGSIRSEPGVSLGRLRVVNGRSRFDEQTELLGDAVLVNGGIEMGPGSSVTGSVLNIAGRVELTGVRVQGDVSTVVGDVGLFGGTHVLGAVRLEARRKGVVVVSDDPTWIVLGPDVVVDGDVEFGREGILWVHDTARVAGEITGVEPRSYSGEEPPRDQL